MSEASSLATTIPRHAGQLVPLFCFRVCHTVCACTTTTTTSIYCCDYGSAFRGPPTLTFFVFDVQASPFTIRFFIFVVLALIWVLLWFCFIRLWATHWYGCHSSLRFLAPWLVGGFLCELRARLRSLTLLLVACS